MKCIYCQRYEHKRHKSVIEHEDGSAEVCDCLRCNESVQVDDGISGEPPVEAVNNRQVLGISAPLATAPIYHIPLSSFTEPVDEFAGMEPPPPYPQPFDRHRFRIAEDRPGVNKYEPWRCVRCRECNYPTWTREQELRFLDDVTCEDCFFLIIEQIHELRVKLENSRAA